MFEELISFDYISPSIIESSHTSSFKVFLNLKSSHHYIFRFIGDLTPLLPYNSNLEIEEYYRNTLKGIDITFESGTDCFISNAATNESAFLLLKTLMDDMPIAFTIDQYNDTSNVFREIYDLHLKNNLREKSISHLDIIDFYIVDDDSLYPIE